jgi:hypothetical protein
VSGVDQVDVGLVLHQNFGCGLQTVASAVMKGVPLQAARNGQKAKNEGGIELPERKEKQNKKQKDRIRTQRKTNRGFCQVKEGRNFKRFVDS